MYELFERERIVDRLERGELKKLVRRSKRLSNNTARKKRLQQDTESQTVYYVDGLTPVVLVHRYLQPDGSIGASGKEDPMWLCTSDRIYIRKKG